MYSQAFWEEPATDPVNQLAEEVELKRNLWPFVV
jgi:hypothetical protein